MERRESAVRVHAKGGEVILVVDNARETFEAFLSPNQAIILANLLLRHAGRAQAQHN